MSSLPSGFEPPAPEDWGQRSLAELREMLKRQERLLRNEKFICRLPDKGKKISDSVARLKAAVADRVERSGRRVRSRPAGTDRLAQPAATAGLGVDGAEAPSSDQALDAPPLPRGSSSADSSGSSPAASPSRGLVHLLHRGGEETSGGPGDKHMAPSAQESEGLPQHSVSSQAEDGSGSSDSLIADQLQRIKIADQGEQVSGGQAKMGDMRGLHRGPPKKPHYMEVLEARAQNPVPVLHKFKTNVLLSQLSDGARGLCQGRESPISSEERRRQDKQHLDDVTAARLLPLHHKPAQLLSIEESLALQKQQKQNYEEMQAKLAAQKLAERVNVKMQSYDPEGAALRRYREARDEDDQSSDDGL